MSGIVLRRRSVPLSGLALIPPVALAYGLASGLGLAFLAAPVTAALIWPAAGLGLALFLRLPRPRWAAVAFGIAMGIAVANLLAGHGVVAMLGFAAFNVAEPLLATLVLGRIFGRQAQGAARARRSAWSWPPSPSSRGRRRCWGRWRRAWPRPRARTCGSRGGPDSCRTRWAR